MNLLTASIEDLTTTSRSLLARLNRFTKMDETISGLRYEVSESKAMVSDALNNDGDFTEASKKFQQVNNKLDRALESRENTLVEIAALETATREALDAATKQALVKGSN